MTELRLPRFEPNWLSGQESIERPSRRHIEGQLRRLMT